MIAIILALATTWSLAQEETVQVQENPWIENVGFDGTDAKWGALPPEAVFTNGKLVVESRTSSIAYPGSMPVDVSQMNLDVRTSVRFIPHDHEPEVDPEAKCGCIAYDNGSSTNYWVLAKKTGADENEWIDSGHAADLTNEVPLRVVISCYGGTVTAQYRFGNDATPFVVPIHVPSAAVGVTFNGSCTIGALAGWYAEPPPFVPEPVVIPDPADGWSGIVGDDTVVAFTNVAKTHTFAVPDGVSSVECLVIGGGGGGGASFGGGGGAGGFVTTNLTALTPGKTWTIQVGAGGVGGQYVNKKYTSGEKGGDSSITSTDLSIIAYGGGSGATTTTAGGDGGSGGGAGGNAGKATAMKGGAAVAGQGNAGGDYSGGEKRAGSGGGGANRAGTQATGYAVGGLGGEGRLNRITGEEVWYAGGGTGGGKRDTDDGKVYEGGLGGGGSGARSRGVKATAGTDGLGGGGGGGGYWSGTTLGAKGGDGVVILRFHQEVSVRVSCDTTRQTCVATVASQPIGPTVSSNAVITVVATPVDGFQYPTVPEGWREGPSEGTIERDFRACADPTEIAVPDATPTRYVTVKVVSNPSRQTSVAMTNGVEIGSSAALNARITVVATPVSGYRYLTVPDGWSRSDVGGAITRQFKALDDPTEIVIPEATVIEYVKFDVACETSRQTYAVMTNGVAIDVQGGELVASNVTVTIVVTPQNGYAYATVPDGWNYGQRTTALTITKDYYVDVHPFRLVIPDATEIEPTPPSAYGADGYVKDGLVSMWDCSTLKNGDTVWPNMAGRNEFTFSTAVTAGVAGVVFPGTSAAYGQLSQSATAATFGQCTNGTMEIAFRMEGKKSLQCVLQSSSACRQQLWVNPGGGYLCNHGNIMVNFTALPKTNGFLTASSCYSQTFGVEPAFVDGLQRTLHASSNYFRNYNKGTMLGLSSDYPDNGLKGVVYSIRLYDRWLSPREVEQNARVDRMRFEEGTLQPSRMVEKTAFGERLCEVREGVGYEVVRYTDTAEDGYTFRVPEGVDKIEVLAVGGGGAGGAPLRRLTYEAPAEGGHAGGLTNLTRIVASGDTFAVKVGAGGAAVRMDVDHPDGANGCAGCATSFGAIVVPGGAGGKGGSAASRSAGGNGAGGSAVAVNARVMGSGGAGLAFDITGENLTYALGGAGGLAGNDNVKFKAEHNARDGGDGFGDGGSGGVGSAQCVSGKGGDGVVIVRYRLPAVPADRPKARVVVDENETVTYVIKSGDNLLASGLEVASGKTVVVTVTPKAGYEFSAVPEGWERGDDGETLTCRRTAGEGILAVVLPVATEIVLPTGMVRFNLPLFADCTITAGGVVLDPVATLPTGTVVTVVAKPKAKAKPPRDYTAIPEGWVIGEEEGSIVRRYVVGAGLLADEIPEPKPETPIAYDVTKYCHDETPLNALNTIYSDLFIHKWLDAPLDGSEPISQAEQDRISDTYITYWLDMAATNKSMTARISALDKAGKGLFYRERWAQAETVYSNLFAEAVEYGYLNGRGKQYEQYLSLAYSRLAETQVGAGELLRARETVREFLAKGLSSGYNGGENVHTMTRHAQHWLNETGLDGLGLPRTTGRAFPEAQQAEYANEYVDAATIKIRLDGVSEDDARVRLLKQKLKKRGFDCQDGAGYPVMIALDPEAPVNRPEGYSLVARPEGCDIRARDLQGVLWGIVSFIQILDPTAHRMRLCSIRDWPDAPRRGFFGRNWSNTCEFAVFNKLNCVTLKPYYLSNCEFDPFNVYCAKSQAQEFKELGLDYYGTVAGITMDCAWPQCWRVFRAMQTEQIMRYASLGVNVYYPYDDSRYDPSVAWMQEDQDSGLMPRDTDAKHIAAIYNDVKMKYPDFKLQFCPPFYWGPTADHPYPDDRNAYLKSIKAYLPKEVDVIWTGERVTSRTKERTDCQWFSDLIGRKPTLFQNESGIHNSLSYIVDRTPWDAWYYSGFVSQDLSAAMKNSDTPSECPQITSLADYLWNVQAYDRTESIRRGLENYVGKGFFEILDPAYSLLCHYDRYQTYGNVNSGRARWVKLEDIERDWVVITNVTAQGRAFAGTSTFNGMGAWRREVEEWTYALLKWVRKHHADDWSLGNETYLTNAVNDATSYCRLNPTRGDLFIDGLSFAEVPYAYVPSASNGGAISTSRLIANFSPLETGEATFTVSRIPRKTCKVCMAAYGQWESLTIKVNGVVVFKGKPTTEGSTSASRRFEIDVPLSVLKVGENALSIYNASSKGYFELVYAVVKLPKESVYLIFE